MSWIWFMPTSPMCASGICPLETRDDHALSSHALGSLCLPFGGGGVVGVPHLEDGDASLPAHVAWQRKLGHCRQEGVGVGRVLRWGRSTCNPCWKRPDGPDSRQSAWLAGRPPQSPCTLHCPAHQKGSQGRRTACYCLRPTNSLGEDHRPRHGLGREDVEFEDLLQQGGAL